MPVEFPSFELQASASALKQLATGIAGWRVEHSENGSSSVWLRTSDGTVWLIGIFRREVTPRFEVFTLGMLSLDELHRRWEGWQPPAMPKDALEGFRKFLATRPPAPAAPTSFDPWPLRSWRTEVVRRAEFVVEGESAGATFDDDPNVQSAARLLSVPPEASAFCEVASGVLFTGDDDRRLLIAVDWMPMNILIVEDAADIDTSECQLVPMEAYPAPAFSFRTSAAHASASRALRTPR